MFKTILLLGLSLTLAHSQCLSGSINKDRYEPKTVTFEQDINTVMLTIDFNTALFGTFYLYFVDDDGPHTLQRGIRQGIYT